MISRRDFLKLSALVTASAALASCAPAIGGPSTYIDPNLFPSNTHYGLYTEGGDKITIVSQQGGPVKLEFYNQSGGLAHTIEGNIAAGNGIVSVPSDLSASTVFVSSTSEISSVIIEGQGNIPHNYVAAPDFRLARITETWRNDEALPVLYNMPGGNPVSTMGKEVPYFIAPKLNNYIGPVIADSQQKLWMPVYQQVTMPNEFGIWTAVNKPLWINLSDYSKASYDITLERGMPQAEFVDFGNEASIESLIGGENAGDTVKLILGMGSMFGDALPDGPFSMGDFADRDKLQIEVPAGIPFYPSPFDENNPHTYATNVGVHVTAIVVDFQAYARGEIKVAALTNLTHIGGEEMLTFDGNLMGTYDVRYWDHTEHPWLKTKDLKWDLWPAAIPKAIEEIQKKRNEIRKRQAELLPVYATAAGLTILAIAAAPLIGPYLVIGAASAPAAGAATYMMMRLAPVVP